MEDKNRDFFSDSNAVDTEENVNFFSDANAIDTEAPEKKKYLTVPSFGLTTPGAGVLKPSESGVLQSAEIPQSVSASTSASPSGATTEPKGISKKLLPTTYKFPFTTKNENAWGEVEIDGKRKTVDKITFDKYEHVVTSKEKEFDTQVSVDDVLRMQPVVPSATGGVARESKDLSPEKKAEIHGGAKKLGEIWKEEKPNKKQLFLSTEEQRDEYKKELRDKGVPDIVVETAINKLDDNAGKEILDETENSIISNIQKKDNIDEVAARKKMAVMATSEAIFSLPEDDREIAEIERETQNIYSKPERTSADYKKLGELEVKRKQITAQGRFYDPRTGEQFDKPEPIQVEAKRIFDSEVEKYKQTDKENLHNIFMEKFLMYKGLQEKKKQIDEKYKGVVIRGETNVSLARQKQNEQSRMDDLIADARLQMTAVAKVYLTNYDPGDIEKGLGYNVEILAKSALKSALGTVVPEEYMKEAEAKGIITASDRELLDYTQKALSGRVDFTPMQKKAFERSYTESGMELGGGLLGILPAMVGMNKVAGFLGVADAVAKLKSLGKIGEFGAFLLETGVEEVKFQGIGGEAGGGLGFITAGRIIPKLPLSGKIGAIIQPFFDKAVQGAVGATVGMELAAAFETTIDALMENKDVQMRLVDAGFGDMDEMTQRVIVGLSVNGIFGLAHLSKPDLLFKPEQLDKAAMELEKSGKNVEAAQVRKKAEQIRGLKTIAEKPTKRKEGEIVAEKTQEEKDTERDETLQQIQQARKERGLEFDVMDDLPEQITYTFEKIDENKPVTQKDLDDASNWLYGKYKEVRAMKSDPKRMLTTEQIAGYMEQLGKDIETLENYKTTQNERTAEQPKAGKETIVEKPIAIIADTEKESIRAETKLPEPSAGTPVITPEAKVAEPKAETPKVEGGKVEKAPEGEPISPIGEKGIPKTPAKPVVEAGEHTQRLEGLLGEQKTKEKFKNIADEIRKGKIEDDLMFSGIPFAKEVWNGAVEVTAKTFELTGNIAQAVADGIAHIKNTKWYNDLTDSAKERAESKFKSEQESKLKKANQNQLAKDELGKLSDDFVKEFNKKTEEKKKTKWDRVIPFINEKFFDVKGYAKSVLEKAGAVEAIWKKNLSLGASAAAKQRFEESQKEIFGTLFKNRLTKEEKTNLNTLILLRRTAELDTMKDKMRQEKKDLENELSTTIDETRDDEIKSRLKEIDRRGTDRIKHTRLVVNGKEVFLTKELAEAWIEKLKTDNPEMYDKINERADKYFAANRELLHERLNAGVIDKETFDRLIIFDYSKRMFVEKMMDSELLQKGGFLSSEIKAIKEGSEDLLFNDAEYLLQQNIASTTRLIFENDANKSLGKLANSVDFIKTQESIGVNKETGQPTYPDAPDGWQQLQFKEDGKLRSIIVPTEFYKSWAVKDPLIKSSVANAIQWLTLTKPIKIMATGINQYFPMYNILRDIGHTYFFTDNYSPLLPKAIGQMGKDFWTVGRDVLLRRGKVKDYIKEGGGMDFLTTQGKPVTSFGKSEVGQAAELLYDAASYLSGTSELMVRVAVRERNIKDLTEKFVKDNGRNPTHAESLEIQKESTEAARQTMDFGSGGEWVKAADNFLPYLGAAFAGLRVAGRSFRQRPGETSVRVAQGIGLVVAGTLYNLKYDEDDEKNGVLGYNAIPAYQKGTGMVIMMPYTTTNSDGDIVRPYIFIPIPQEFSPFKTISESMTELMKTGRFNGAPLKRGFLQAIPYKDPREIPVVDMLYSYELNYDRFRDKKIWTGDNVKPSDEFYKGRTPEMYQDWGKITEMSPERTKVAMGKVLTDQESNIYTQAISAGYDKVKDALSNDAERKEFNDMMAKNIEGNLAPLQKKFYKFPNKKEMEKELIERAEQEENSKRKIEEKDKVREFLLKYKNAETEGERSKIKQDVRQYALKTGKKSIGATQRILNSFNTKQKISKVKNDIIVDLAFMDSPEAAARVYYEIWKESTPEKRKSLESDLKTMDVNTPRFNATLKEISKGKINTEESHEPPWEYQKK